VNPLFSLNKALAAAGASAPIGRRVEPPKAAGKQRAARLQNDRKENLKMNAAEKYRILKPLCPFSTRGWTTVEYPVQHASERPPQDAAGFTGAMKSAWIPHSGQSHTASSSTGIRPFMPAGQGPIGSRYRSEGDGAMVEHCRQWRGQIGGTGEKASEYPVRRCASAIHCAGAGLGELLLRDPKLVLRCFEPSSTHYYCRPTP